MADDLKVTSYRTFTHTSLVALPFFTSDIILPVMRLFDALPQPQGLVLNHP